MTAFPTAAHIFIGQKFGIPAEMYTQFGLRGHNGVDLLCPLHTPVYACDAGTVSEAAEKTSGYGRRIYLQHDGYLSVYGHLKTMAVRAGDKVTSGQKIGTSGGDLEDPYRGSSTGPHLHFEVRPSGEPTSNGYGGAVDPLAWLLEKFIPPAMYRVQVTTAQGVSVRCQPAMFFDPSTGRCGVLSFHDSVDGMERDATGQFMRLRSLRPEWVPLKFVMVMEIPGTVSITPLPGTKSVEDRLTIIEKLLKEHGWIENGS